MALKIIDALRTNIASQELRASFIASERRNYELYTDLMMRLHKERPSEGYDAAALQANEHARARSLVELLTEARVDIRQGIDPALLERERSLQRLLNAKAERQIRLLSSKHTEEQAAAAVKEIDALTTQYQEVQAQIRATSPRYTALTQPQPLTLPEIQRQALDDDTLLLEYALGEERSYLWLVSPHSITSFELPARAVVEDATRRVYDLLTARVRQMPDETAAQRRARIARSDKDYPAAAAALSRETLGPVAAQLGKKRLVIVSDGALQYIPFAILPKPAGSTATGGKKAVIGSPLMLEHEIVSLPSASTLAVMRRELAGRHPAPKIAAVLADPVFESNDPRVKTAAGAQQKPAGDQDNRQDTALKTTFIPRALDETGVVNPGQPIPRLPYSQREAAIIQSLAPERLRKLALGFEASYATATSSELSEYRIVHFATHGLLNSKQPELSGILLSLVDERGQPQENGLLRLGEIYNLKLPAELVVLSACQTALGKDVKGEGLVGLTRGFMYAGAARVMASLWAVEDRATGELMKRFYEGMLGERKLRPADALRQAQIAMWRKAEWRSPYYWGAFTIQGEWK
jgi:CHAT domain-containing protein